MHVSKKAIMPVIFPNVILCCWVIRCGAHTFPYIEVKNNTAVVEHEATTSKIGEDQIFYCNQRGIDTEKAVALDREWFLPKKC